MYMYIVIWNDAWIYTGCEGRLHACHGSVPLYWVPFRSNRRVSRPGSTPPLKVHRAPELYVIHLSAPSDQSTDARGCQTVIPYRNAKVVSVPLYLIGPLADESNQPEQGPYFTSRSMMLTGWLKTGTPAESYRLRYQVVNWNTKFS